MWHVSAYNMELWSSLDHPSTHPQLSFFCKCCAVSPPQQSMCGVPPSQYMLSVNVVRCPHPICSTHQEGMCGVPPFQYKFFCAVSPPCNSVPLPHLTLSWILSKVENLESSSLQDEANFCLRVWHSQLSFYYVFSKDYLNFMLVWLLGHIFLSLKLVPYNGYDDFD